MITTPCGSQKNAGLPSRGLGPLEHPSPSDVSAHRTFGTRSINEVGWTNVFSAVCQALLIRPVVIWASHRGVLGLLGWFLDSPCCKHCQELQQEDLSLGSNKSQVHSFRSCFCEVFGITSINLFCGSLASLRVLWR